MRAFINTVGSSEDPAAAEALLRGWGLLSPPGVDGGAWLSVGLDCPPAACTTANGSAALPCAHVHAAAALGALRRDGGASQRSASSSPAVVYTPLSVAQVLAALQQFWPTPGLH